MEALVFAVRMSCPQAFVEYARWVYVVLNARSISPHLAEMLDLIAKEMRQTLGEPVWAAAEPLFDAALEALQTQPTEHALYEVPSINELSRTYLGTVLKGKRRLAELLLWDTYQAGMTLRDIYLQVLQPVLYTIGHHWELNRISVAQEHMATAITKDVMAILTSEVVAIQPRNELVIVACLSENRHEVGPRMVADLLHEGGYEILNTGADTPAASLLALIDEHKPAVIALSATLGPQVGPIRALVEQIHSDFIFYHPTILVGGMIFNLADDLWKKVGGDVWAKDAGEAVDRLIGG